MHDNTQKIIDELARSQLGHVTRAQLRAAGISASTIRRHEASGRLLRVGSRTFRLASAADDPYGMVLAACLDLDGVASHRTAAWIHGHAPRPDSIEITVPKGRSTFSHRLVDRAGRRVRLRVHTSTNLPPGDVVTVRGIATTSVARTMLSLAALVPAELTAGQLADVIGTAVDRGDATDAWLWWLLDRRRCRGRNGVRVLEDVLAGRARLGPTESWLERELQGILDRAGLPLPVTQRVIERSGRFAARVDFAYVAEWVVIEALGHEHHRTAAQTEADTRRANELQLLGFEVLQFTARQIARSPESVVTTVRAALERAASRAA